MNKILIALSALLLISGCSSSEKSITGAGATFPLPFYNMIFNEYRDSSGINVNYGGIGSGGGIKSLNEKVVEFAGSDAYLSEEEMASMPEVVHIPSCMGAVVMAYNIPGCKALNLTGEIISGIYLGKITNWNDPAIAEVNPGMELPDLKITPVYRSDGSGTTFVFSDYLSKASKDWAEGPGTGKSLKWPAGIAAKGNPGVAGIIASTEGSVGYIGSEYSFALNIPAASIRNRAGEFVSPSTESISAAASGDVPDDLRFMITDPENAGAYPISCFTWLLIYKEQAYDGRPEEKARELVNLMKWVISEDVQSLTEKVHYAPLPAQVREKAMKALSEVTYNGQQIR